MDTPIETPLKTGQTASLSRPVRLWSLPAWAVALVFAVAGGFLLALLILPMGTLLATLSNTDAGIAGEIWKEIEPVVYFTLKQASLSALGSGVLGLVLGMVLRNLLLHRSERTRSRALGWIQVPFVLPTIVIVQLILFWFGQAGWSRYLGFSLGYSFATVVITHVLINATWVASLVAQAALEIPFAQWEAARILGAGRWARFRRVAWPYLRPEWVSGVAQVFCLCVTSFTVVLLLGGGPPVETLETVIYTKIRYSGIDLPGAIWAALIQGALTVPILIGSIWWKRSRALPVVPARSHSRGLSRGRSEISGVRGLFNLVGNQGNLALVLWVGPWVLAGVPLFFQALVRLPEFEAKDLLTSALIQSFSIAGVVLLFTALISVAVLLSGWVIRLRYPRWSELWYGLFLLPSGLSVLMVALGIWLTYERWLDPFATSGNGSGAGGVLIVLTQSLMFLPFLLRIVLPLTQRSQLRVLEAARILGATPFRAFWVVEWPRWRGPWLRGLLMVGAFSIGEFAVISFFSTGERLTLPQLQAQLIAQYRFDEAVVIAGLLWFVATAIWLWRFDD